MASDLYETLQVSPNAEPEIIDSAYRSLAKKYHPDVNDSRDTEALMKAINQAYSVLSDPTRRASYDWKGGRPASQQWAEPKQRSTAQPAPSWGANVLDAGLDFRLGLVLTLAFAALVLTIGMRFVGASPHLIGGSAVRANPESLPIQAATSTPEDEALPEATDVNAVLDAAVKAALATGRASASTRGR